MQNIAVAKDSVIDSSKFLVSRWFLEFDIGQRIQFDTRTEVPSHTNRANILKIR